MLTEVRFPWIPPQAGWAFMEFARRSGDYALVGAAAVLTPALDDRCMVAHIAYLGIAGAPVRARAVEDVLVGTTLDDAILSDDWHLLAVDEALEKLAAHDPLGAQLIKLRFFAGLPNVEAARLLEIPERTAKRTWAYARAWLYEELKKTL